MFRARSLTRCDRVCERLTRYIDALVTPFLYICLRFRLRKG
jgi:hypothetical protein